LRTSTRALQRTHSLERLNWKRSRHETKETNSGHTVLILSGNSPESYAPAGERIRHIALASELVFGKAIILALGSKAAKTTGKADSKILLQQLKLKNELPYPITAFFDPLKFMLLSIHSIFLSLRYKVSYIVASMPPLEVGMSGLFTAKLLGVDLIVDLRDDWESAVERNISRYIPEQMLEIVFWLARRVYSSATALIVATSTIAEIAKKRGIEKPTILASNGADTSLFIPQDKATRKKIRTKHALPQNKIIVIYIGSGANVYYRLDYVLSSVCSLPEEVKRHFFFVFYLYDGIEIVKNMKEKLRISDDLVKVRNPVSRVVLAEVMAACDVGLVPFDDERYLLCARSAKLYEYLSTGLYVVGSGPEDGELNQLLSNKSQLGMFCLPSVKNFLNVFLGIIRDKAYIRDVASRSLRHRFIQENYERRMIAVKAMKTIDSLLIHSSAKRQNAV
jgi:hypothetical protein